MRFNQSSKEIKLIMGLGVVMHLCIVIPSEVLIQTIISARLNHWQEAKQESSQTFKLGVK